MRAEISCGVYFLPSISAFQSVPMWRLTDAMVRSTLVTAWRLAVSPTSTSPSLVNATTDGVVRKPSAFAMTVGSPPSRTETTELVVPRSIPTARAMCVSPSAGAFSERMPRALRPAVGPAVLARNRSPSRRDLSLDDSSFAAPTVRVKSGWRNLSALDSTHGGFPVFRRAARRLGACATTPRQRLGRAGIWELSARVRPGLEFRASALRGTVRGQS